MPYKWSRYYKKKKKTKLQGSWKYVRLKAPKIDWEPEIEESYPKGPSKPKGPIIRDPRRNPHTPKSPFKPTRRGVLRKPPPRGIGRPITTEGNLQARGPDTMKYTSPWQQINTAVTKHQDSLRPWYVPKGYDMTKSFTQNFKNSLRINPNITKEKFAEGLKQYLFTQNAYPTDPESGQKVAQMFGMTAKEAAAYLPWVALPGLPGEGAILGTAGKIFTKLFPRITQAGRIIRHGAEILADKYLLNPGLKPWQNSPFRYTNKFDPEMLNTGNFLIPNKAPKGPKNTFAGKSQNTYLTPVPGTPQNNLWPLPYSQRPTAPFWANFNAGVRQAHATGNSTIRGTIERATLPRK